MIERGLRGKHRNRTNDAGEAYGFERLETVLAGLPADVDAATATAAVMADVARFAAGAQPSDDITVLVLRYTGR